MTRRADQSVAPIIDDMTARPFTERAKTDCMRLVRTSQPSPAIAGYG